MANGDFVSKYKAAQIEKLLDKINVFDPSSYSPGSSGGSGTGTPGADGKSAYQLALDNGYDGTLEQWLESLKGAPGTPGENGTNGKSAYQIWLDAGNTGNESDFLNSLKGTPGTPGVNGTNGKSAYQLAVENGFEGSESDWLASLKGADGDDSSTELIAPTEESSLVAHAYSEGEQLVYNGVLYTVTTPLAIGDPIVVNTNVVASGTVTEQIGDINDEIGDLSNLNTTAKTSLVDAINEAAQSGGSGGSSGGTVIAEVTGDGAMTYSAALDSLYAQIMANGGIDRMKQYALICYSISNDNWDILPLVWDNPNLTNTNPSEFAFNYSWINTNDISFKEILLRESNSVYRITSSKDSVHVTDDSNSVLPTDMKLQIIEYAVNNLANGERIELVEAGTDTTFSAQIDKFYSPLSQLTDEQLLNTFVTYGNTIYRYINHTNDRYIYSCITADDRDAYGNVFYIDRVIVKSSGSKFYDTTVNGTTHTVNELTNASMSSEDAMGLCMQASQGSLSGVEVLAHVEGQDGLSFADGLESIVTQLQSVDIGEYFDDVFFKMTEVDQNNNDIITYNMKLIEVLRNSNQEAYGYFFTGFYIANASHNARRTYEFYFESGKNRVFDNGSNINYSSWTIPEDHSMIVYRRK